MIESKEDKLKRLQELSERRIEAENQLAQAFIEAAKAEATAQELSNATALSVEQVRYFASKNRVRLTPAQRGPKVH